MGGAAAGPGGGRTGFVERDPRPALPRSGGRGGRAARSPPGPRSISRRRPASGPPRPRARPLRPGGRRLRVLALPGRPDPAPDSRQLFATSGFLGLPFDRDQLHYGLVFQAPFYAGGRLDAARDIAASRAAQAALLVEGTRWEVRATIVAAYAAVQSLDAAARAANRTLDALDATRRRLALAVDEGKRPRLDLPQGGRGEGRRGGAGRPPRGGRRARPGAAAGRHRAPPLGPRGVGGTSRHRAPGHRRCAQSRGGRRRRLGRAPQSPAGRSGARRRARGALGDASHRRRAGEPPGRHRPVQSATTCPPGNSRSA